jgi:hypothetical protein
VQWAERAAAISLAIGHEGRGHRRLAYGTLVWCDICGAYAERFAVGLARPCPGRPLYASRAAQLRRLQRGRHPLTGIPFRDDAIAEHHCSDGSTRLYPVGAPAPSAQERWGSVHESTADRRTDPTRARPSRVMGRSHLAATPVLERRQPTSPVAQPTVADRMTALRRRLQSKWDNEHAQGAALEHDPPNAATGSADRGAVPPSTVEVAQPTPGAGEASHLTHRNTARAYEHGDDEVDDARGSKRRRLVAALAAPVQVSSPPRSTVVTTTRRPCNVTRTDARNDDTRMKMRTFGSSGIVTDEDTTPSRGKKYRQG